MNIEIQCLFEPFLVQYYLFDAVFGQFLQPGQRTALISDLRGIFCIPDDEEMNEIIEKSELKPYKDIQDVSEYERFCRLIQFASISEQELEITVLDKMILDQKREALTVKSELFKQYKNLTQETLYTTLLTAAMNGNIRAMTTLAYMEYNGICIPKDKNNAIKRIKLAAKWNDLFGNLMGIAYDPENEATYYNTLFTTLSGEVRRDTFAYLCAAKNYSGKREINRLAKILERAFGLGEIKRETYAHMFAYALFSEIIPVEDKEKILLSNQQQMLDALADIPFGSLKKSPFVFDESAAETIKLNRPEETAWIKQNLKIASLCRHNVYKPLMIVSADDYVTAQYSDMIKRASKGTVIAELDASTLTDRDFAGSNDNFIIRTISETKSASTMFFLKNCDMMEVGLSYELAKILEYEYRHKFKLFHPPISLDLSSLKFVLFAGTKNQAVKNLSEKCDTVCAAPVSAKEKADAITDIFHIYKREYSCNDVELLPESVEYLCTFDMGSITRMINEAVRYALCNGITKISTDDLKSSGSINSASGAGAKFGFAGGSNAKH